MSRPAVLLVLLLAASARAAPPLFDVDAVAGKPLRGALANLAGSWDLTLSGQEKPLSAADWVGLRRVGMAPPAPPAEAHLLLTTGDRVPVAATSLALVGSQLSLSSPWLAGGKATRLALGAIALVWRTAPDGVEDAGALQRRLLAAPRRRDAIVLRNGDVLEGVLVKLDGRGVELKVERRPVRVEMAQVAAVALSSVLASSARPRELHGKLVLSDGSRFSLRSAASDGTTLTGETLQRANLAVPLDQVVALDLLQGRSVYLSDLKTKKHEQTAYLGVGWPLAVDESVAGRELRLGGGVYERGLGMHSAARVSYALPEGAKRFEALVGLDDATGRQGQVRLRVLVDGQDRDLPGKGACRHRDGPLAVRVDVAGGRELTLVVEFGPGGDVGDHVNWVNARIVR